MTKRPSPQPATTPRTSAPAMSARRAELEARLTLYVRINHALAGAGGDEQAARSALAALGLSESGIELALPGIPASELAWLDQAIRREIDAAKAAQLAAAAA
jgi:hypothetical protein